MNTNEPTHVANNAPTRRRNASVWSHRSVFKAIRMLVAAVVLLCLPTVGIAAKFLIDWGRNWWADRKARVASKSIVTDDETKARTSLAAAMQASPDNPQVLRAWAAYLKRYGGSAVERVSILKRLAEFNEATIADKTELAIAQVDTGAFSDARQIIAALPESFHDSVEVMEARAALTEAAGDREGADAMRRAAWGSDLSTTRNRLKLAELDLKALVPEIRSQAIAELWRLAKDPDTTGLDACQILARHPSLSRPQADELSALVQAHPKASQYDRLLALSGILRTQPEKRDAILDRETSKAAKYGLNDLLDFVVLLDREGEFQRLIDVISWEKALKNRELFIMRIKALMETRQLSELEIFLTERRDLPCSTGYVSAVLAHVRLQQGRITDAMTTLNQAQQQAAAHNDVDTTRRVAGFAERQAWWEISAKAYEWLAANAPALRSGALQGLYKCASAQLDAQRMLEAAERLVGGGSEHIPTVANLAYLRLLTGSKMESVPVLMEKLRADPDVSRPALQATESLLNALLAYRYGDVEGARDHIAGVADWTLVPPGKRAVAAALFHYCGSEAAAIGLASEVRALGLLDEEEKIWETVHKNSAALRASK